MHDHDFDAEGCDYDEEQQQKKKIYRKLVESGIIFRLQAQTFVHHIFHHAANKPFTDCMVQNLQGHTESFIGTDIDSMTSLHSVFI